MYLCKENDVVFFVFFLWALLYANDSWVLIGQDSGQRSQVFKSLSRHMIGQTIWLVKILNLNTWFVKQFDWSINYAAWFKRMADFSIKKAPFAVDNQFNTHVS